MRKILLATLALTLSLTLTGCYERSEAQATDFSSNGIKIEKLFTKDSCTLYRFRDGNVRTVYYADCAKSASTMTEESCGKNCTYPQITTSNKAE